MIFLSKIKNLIFLEFSIEILERFTLPEDEDKQIVG